MASTHNESKAEESLDYEGNVSFWSNRWEENKTGWHRSTVNPTLTTNLARITGGNPNKRFFVPLCGKSLDIPYLYQQGHQVFGVEAVAKAIEELSNENSLGLKLNPETSTYATEDGRIRIYCGDIFTCPFEKFGPFDCVWDRGSFIALEYPFRPAYKEMVQRSLRVGADGKSYHNFQYLLETVDYNREKYGGPPRAVDAKDIEEYFADWTNVEVVSKTHEETGNVASKPDIGEVYQIVYMMTPK